jgi:hypothetical protein
MVGKEETYVSALPSLDDYDGTPTEDDPADQYFSLNEREEEERDRIIEEYLQRRREGKNSEDEDCGDHEEDLPSLGLCPKCHLDLDFLKPEYGGEYLAKQSCAYCEETRLRLKEDALYFCPSCEQTFNEYGEEINCDEPEQNEQRECEDCLKRAEEERFKMNCATNPAAAFDPERQRLVRSLGIEKPVIRISHLEFGTGIVTEAWDGEPSPKYGMRHWVKALFADGRERMFRILGAALDLGGLPEIFPRAEFMLDCGIPGLNRE